MENRKKELENLINLYIKIRMLKTDIRTFGATEQDLFRLNSYIDELKNISE